MSSETARKIEVLTDQFANGTFDLKPNEIIRWLNMTLPIEKMHQDTMKRRVEGYSHLVDKLWKILKKMYKFDRDEILLRAAIKPASYYHYHLGSSVPADEFVTRDDFFKDPVIALTKLCDDVKSLVNLIIELK